MRSPENTGLNTYKIIRKRYWELIADNLSKAGWSWGCVSAIDREGKTIWIADAHRGDGKRFVARADEKLTAFVELEAATQAEQSIARHCYLCAVGSSGTVKVTRALLFRCGAAIEKTQLSGTWGVQYLETRPPMNNSKVVILLSCLFAATLTVPLVTAAGHGGGGFGGGHSSGGHPGMGMPGRPGMGMRGGGNRHDHFDHHHDFIFIGDFGFPW